MQVSRLRGFVGLFAFALALWLAAAVYAGVTASISGTVTDSSGAAISGATVTATNVDTGVAYTQTTNAQGYYSFQQLPLGKYTIEVQQTGFKTTRRTDIVLEVNEARVIDVVLQVGQKTETVQVQSDALHVETANTQMGEVIEGKQMTSVPLAYRSYTDLLALQPGVVSQTSGMTGAYAGNFLSATFAIPQVSGDLNSGQLSVNGQREGANGFILNGVTVQETGFSGAGAIPNLDSIAEFRILTNNFDAEYGNYSGGQINVVTKSGTNDWHGNAFEFLRNTDFDAANFFESGNRGSYHQNQFGGTFGGPVLKDKLFFFADYQGNRVIQAVPQNILGAPTQSEENGDLSAIAAADGFATPTVLPGVNGGNPVPVPTTVNGGAWANQLTQQFSSSTGQTVTAGEPYYFQSTDYNPATNAPYGVNCTSTTQCVFANGQLPTAAFNGISAKLLQFIQPVNTPQGSFFTNAGKINLSDNKFSGRLDYNTGEWGLLSAYYYHDKFNRIDPYWASPRPTYPGFSIESRGWTDVVDLGDTKTFGSATVNEFRFGYFRLDTPFNQPLGGTGPEDQLAALGFASGQNRAPGIYVGTPSVEGIPETDFNNYSIGVPSKPIRITQNSFQLVDNFSRVIGTHTLKIGAQFHYNFLEENLSNAANGNFFFGTAVNGGTSETGSDFADFLLGAPSSFVQGLSFPSYGRSYYLGAFAQDSWRIKSNLTLNYGLRWDINSFWHEKYNEIQTIIPGEQSLVFPGSPRGWVFPGDPGVPNSLAPTRWNNFAPRLGLAYSFGDHEGILGKILGKPGDSSIRVGYGKFYTALEGATNFNEIGDAPFGDYTGQSSPTFAAPFTNRASGNSILNFFPIQPPPKNFSINNPATNSCVVGQFCPYDNLVDFVTAYGTIGSSPAFYYKNKSPYAENYELSLQRQITSSDLLTVSYVGTQGHHLLLALSANPGNPAACLALSTPASVMPGTPTCGPGGENTVYTLPDGTLVGGTRPLNFQVAPNGVVMLPSGPTVAFGNDSYFINIGNSAYNSAQISWRHTSGRLQTLVGYTFSKAIDLASGYGEQVNPLDPKLSRGLSAFDSTHNFVASYNYRLPIDMLPGPKKLTNGWGISGITRFATGLPVTLVETDDHSLEGTNFGGPIPLNADTPDIVAPVKIVNPRTVGACPGLPTATLYFFCPSSFQSSQIGLEGTANRRFFHGPGVNNWDFAVLKDTQLNERFNLQFRGELFNIWNHAQFVGPSGVMSSNFGLVSQAALPRIGQLSLKLNF